MTIKWSQSRHAYVDHNILFAKCGLIVHEGAITKTNKKDIKIHDLRHCIDHLNKLLFASAVDNFQTYLSNILYEIYSRDSRTLYGKKISPKIVFESPDINSARKEIVERYISDLGYKNIAELSDIMDKELGIDSLSKPLTKLRLNRIIQVRNIISHNRGIVNDIFITRSKSKRDSVGESVRFWKPLVAAKYLDGLMRRIDEEAVTKFGL